MTSRKSDDPDQILNCDPAAVAIRASQSYDTLQKLKEFAQQLMRYVSLMEDAKVVDLSQDDDDIVGELVVETTTPPAVAGRPAQVTMMPRHRGKSISDTITSSADCETISRKEKINVSQSIFQGLRLEDAPPSKQLTTELPRKSQPPANPTTSGSPKAATRSVRTRSQVATPATPSPSQKRRLRIEEEDDDDEGGENGDSDYQLGETIVRETVASNDSIIPPRRMVARRTTTVEPPSYFTPEKEEEEKQEKARTRRPRSLPPGCKGDLKSCRLQRSVGRTRVVLNKYLDSLCLVAKFGMGVVSKQGNRVSHLTLNNTWNYLPRTQDETLEWWLREGAHRLTLASPLDPSIQKQPKEGIPIFWACDNNRQGGALCHYIGHFRCIGLTKTDTAVMMLEYARQALIEFEFIKFDESLTRRISNLPESIS
jgi:hypothetical protein